MKRKVIQIVHVVHVSISIYSFALGMAMLCFVGFPELFNDNGLRSIVKSLPSYGTIQVYDHCQSRSFTLEIQSVIFSDLKIKNAKCH